MLFKIVRRVAISLCVSGSVALGLVFITPALGSLFLGHIGLASGFGAFLLARPWKKTVVVNQPPPLEPTAMDPQIVSSIPIAPPEA